MWSILWVKWLIVKYTLVLVFKKIWDVILVLLLAQTLFTAVSGDVLSVVGEFVYSQKTVVCTALTACELCGVGELVYLVDCEHCCLVISLMALACDECGTKGTHDTCDIRPCGMYTCYFFKASKNGIIVECTALDYDIFTEVACIRQFDNLEKCILYY